MNNIKHVTGTYIGVDYQFEGFDRELMNNRFILLKKCLDKLESIPIEPASVWDYEYKQDVKKYLNEIAANKFIYADTGKPRLNMQKFYGKTAKKIKEAFNELCDCVNTNYKNYFVIMMELNIDITAFLKELDLEIVKYLFLAMKNKYRITAWFKKTWLYILSERNKYKYPQELLDKLNRESRESFRDINFYEGFPLPLSAQYPDYFDQKLDTIYIAPEYYKNIMPSSKLLNKKFEYASVRWNYGYGYASSCQANNDRGLYLEKIHNLNIKNKENVKGYEYYKNKIKKANQEVEKIIVDAEIEFNKQQQAMDEERVNRAKIDDYLNYWIAVYDFYQNNPNYRENPNEEIENRMNYPNGNPPNYSNIRELNKRKEELSLQNADYERDEEIQWELDENGEAILPLDYEWMMDQKRKRIEEEKKKRKEDKKKLAEFFKNANQETEEIIKRNNILNKKLNQQYVELPEPGVIPTKKTVHKTKKSTQKEPSLPVPQTDGSLPIPETTKKKKGRPRKNPITNNSPIVPSPNAILPPPNPTNNSPITPNNSILPRYNPAGGNTPDLPNEEIDIFKHKFTFPFVLTHIKPQSLNEFLYVLSKLEEKFLKEWNNYSAISEQMQDEFTDDYED